ncbi:MAG TPA: hypothetical protein VLC09_02505 [Polyangiaceae bacterium]|nr:hypothetical protein [Polyangiaceae bacterium]
MATSKTRSRCADDTGLHFEGTAAIRFTESRECGDILSMSRRARFAWTPLLLSLAACGLSACGASSDDGGNGDDGPSANDSGSTDDEASEPVAGGLTEVTGDANYDPSQCPAAQASGYTIVEDPAYEDYQIRKVGAVTFDRYELDEGGNEIRLTDDYEVVTAFPKRYLLSQVHDGKTFAVDEREGYYVVDSDYALPHIPCVTDDVIYAPVVTGLHEPEVIERGINLGWPIQQDISEEVALYQGQDKMWVYTTWPGYRYGYWFKDETGTVRPTWLFHSNDESGEVTFTPFSSERADWPEGAYNDVPYGLHIDTSGKVYVPKVKPIDFPQQKDRPPVPKDVRLAYPDWNDELRCVVINRSSQLVANTRTIWPGGSEAYYPAESFLPGYAVIGQDSDGYWGLKGRETDAAAWWAGDDCVDGKCPGQSRFPYRNGCRIDSYDFGQGDGFNWLELKDHMIEIGVVLDREEMYRLKIFLQDGADEPARMLAELYYEQDDQGRWQPRLNPGTNEYQLTGGDNPRYIVNGYIWPGQRIFAVIEDL